MLITVKGGVKLNDLKINSNEIQNLGQGLHALQDSYAHKGRSDVGFDHLWNDIFGFTGSAQFITSSAINIYKLLTSDFTGIKESKKGVLTLDLSGMSSNQKQTVIDKALEFLQQEKKKTKK